MIYNFYRIIRFILNKVSKFLTNLISFGLFKVNKIYFKNGFQSSGIPLIFVQGTFKIGEDFKINNTIYSNPIGRNHKCMFVVRKDAQLIIGSNVGMSGTTIVCHKAITIGDNVKIGGNVCIYDTDFHSLDSVMRRNYQNDQEKTIQEEITIADDVFVGAHTSILKGVSVGKNSIIGACSVVTKNIPANEIWGGNPARFLRKINEKT